MITRHPLSMNSLLLVLALAIVLPGCTLVPERPAVDRAWFLLEVPDAPVSGAASVPVELASVRIAPELAGKGLVYRLGPYRYESDFYNEWFLNPRDHVEQLLRERWTREGAPATLVANAASERGARKVDILVTALHGDLQVEAAGMARVGLRVFVQSGNATRLWNLEQGVPMASRSPDALVAALSAGTAALLTDLEQRLRE